MMAGASSSERAIIVEALAYMDSEKHVIMALQRRIAELETEISRLRELLSQHNIHDTDSTVPPQDECRIIFPEITAWHAKTLYSFFKGRKDVYSKRNTNKDGKGVYYPVCRNFWQLGKCPRRDGVKTRCMDCENREWIPLNQRVLIRHLKGEDLKGADVVGIYPLLENETCNFLVFDFDHHDDEQPIDWTGEVDSLRALCQQLSIDVLVERSRSGNGAHVWLFFATPIPAKEARRFGSCLLTKGAELVQQKSFLAYDRMLPAQDTMPEGGLGNLIALPLQGNALKSSNSAFVDENWAPYPDQWQKLMQIKRLSHDFVKQKIQEWGVNSELGVTSMLEQLDSPEPWKRNVPFFSSRDVGGSVQIVDANMLYVRTENLTPRFCNILRRLASFRNPLYFRNRAMGLSVKHFSRIIPCFDEHGSFLGIPRGKKEQIMGILSEKAIDVKYEDLRQNGKPLNIDFTVSLYPEQQKAADEMLKHDIGILHAATAFGKTAVGAYLIAERKVNALVLVHNREIMKNWIEDLSRFLCIDEPLPTYTTPAGRIRKRKKHIGCLYATHNSIGGIIDVAMITSLGTDNNIDPIVQNYGLVLMDECHHAAAHQASCVLNQVKAKFVYGLTATPKRDDGMEQKLLMTFGPIRYRYTARQRADSQNVNHFLYPRYTRYWYPEDSAKIQDIYRHLLQDEARNKCIIDDVLKCIADNRTPLILTKFKKQAELLYSALEGKVKHLFLLQGGRKTRERDELRKKLQEVPAAESVVIVAIGQYIGEGFNYPRLDTLMLATPISWEGNVEQYAGRLHRDYDGKKDVIIYDYVDMRVSVLNKMYSKRLKTYNRMGYALYQTLPLFSANDEKRSFYEASAFEPVLENDILAAKLELIISSPLLSLSKVRWLLDLMNMKKDSPLKMTVFTAQNPECNENTVQMSSLVQALRNQGISVLENMQHHERFVIVDRHIVWYGDADFLSHSKNSDNVIRMVNPEIAADILYAMSGKIDAGVSDES